MKPDSDAAVVLLESGSKGQLLHPEPSDDIFSAGCGWRPAHGWLPVETHRRYALECHVTAL